MESATEPSVPSSVGRAVKELDRREREILAFESQWWKYAGAKEQAIRELFDMSATRYYQVLNALVDKPEALAADPPPGAGCAGCEPAGSAPVRRVGWASSPGEATMTGADSGQ